MKQLVDALTVALEQDINQLEWMTADTKKKALEKLHALNKNKIGYPDKWRDYSSVDVARARLREERPPRQSRSKSRRTSRSSASPSIARAGA